MAQRFGLIAGAAAAAVVVAWLAPGVMTADGPAKTIRAEADPSVAHARSARADLAEGKRLYRAQEYRAAVRSLVRATRFARELTIIEREELQNYLQFARSGATRQATAGDDRPVIRAQSADGTTAQAQDLLKQAREAISAGDFKAAEAKIEQAEQLDVVYNVFDDRPDLVRQDLAHVQKYQGTNPPTGQPRTPAAGQPKPVASQETAASARALVAEARAALKTGDTAAALEKAAAAEKLGAEFSAFEDRPEMIRADAAKQAAARPAETQTTKNPFASNTAAAPATTPLAEMPAEPKNVSELFAENKPAAAGAALQTDAAARSEPVPQTDPANAGQPTVAGEPASNGLQPNEEMNALLDGEAISDDTAATMEAAAEPATEANAEPPVKTADVQDETPAGAKALELYEFGIERLREGDTQGAYAAFLEAHRSGETLDPYRHEQLQNYLRELSPSAKRVQQASGTGGPALAQNTGGASEALKAATQAEKVRYDELRTEVLNTIFRAERLRESKPDEAIAMIDRTLEAVGAAELPEQHLDRLSRQLEHSRESIASYAKQMAPRIELNEQNENVKAEIERELADKARKEEELKGLVDEYNKLVEQKRYAEAEQVARQATALDPDNPIAVTMLYKAKVLYEKGRNEEVRDAKADYFLDALYAVDEASVGISGEVEYAEDWEALTERRLEKYGESGVVETEVGREIRGKLDQPISLHFDNVPLSQVVADMRSKMDTNIVIDTVALDAQGITSDTPISIDVDGIMVKSALNLLLEPLGLGYVVENEVLNITSHAKQEGDLETHSYPVADLVIPIPNFGGDPTTWGQESRRGFGQNSPAPAAGGAPHMSIPSMGPQNFPQVVDPARPIADNGVPRVRTTGGPRSMGFDSLISLISSTIAPDSWKLIGGDGVLHGNEQTLSLVVRQTQQVHEEIEDLLRQLRNLQDIQVTVEVRFISVSDDFAEFIGVDFDFNVQDTMGGPVGPGFGEETAPGDPASAETDPTQGETGQGFFETDNPDRDRRNYDSYRQGTVVGYNPGGVTPDLDIPFRQGSFDFASALGENVDLNAGAQVGFAILSDIEAFFFIQAVQQDSRSNVLSAPKVTLFNGQTARVRDVVERPFVTSLRPIVGIGAVGFAPEIDTISTGPELSVQAVVSADRRYVRLSLFPQFRVLIDVETFTFSTGATTGDVGVGTGGIGGGRVARNALLAALPAQQQNGEQGGQDGQDGQNGQDGQDGQDGQAGEIGGQTVQQPIIAETVIQTTVSVPDGGTILMGGVKRLTENRQMAGVPILNKLPYVNRLFKNSGVSRQTSSLMMMVTPRIIIADEEEEMLASPLTP